MDGFYGVYVGSGGQVFSFHGGVRDYSESFLHAAEVVARPSVSENTPFPLAIVFFTRTFHHTV